MKVKIGMKVHVFSPDKKDYLGIGKIIRVEKKQLIIKLEDETELGGLDCCWGKVSNIDPYKIQLFDEDDIKEITEQLIECYKLPWYEKVRLHVEYLYENMSIKNKRTIRMIPRVMILMSFATFFAGFLYCLADLLAYVFGIILLGIFLFFIPLDKLLDEEK